MLLSVASLSTASAPVGALSPAQIVALRFRPEASPVVAAPAGYALASVDNQAPRASRQVSNPRPAYASLSGGVPSDPAVEDDASPPGQAMSYAPAAPASRVAPAVKRVTPPRPASASASNTVLNNAQIASIHERLRLSSYQQQLWPPVESALREIAYRQANRKSTYRTETQPPVIDTNSAEVQRLKSAAIPLIMSMNEDQKQEVRTMARLMGLEQLASAF